MVVKIFGSNLILKEISSMIIAAFQQAKLGAVANFMVDHKKIYSVQNDTMGIHLRFTWINTKSEFKAVRLDFKLKHGC